MPRRAAPHAIFSMQAEMTRFAAHVRDLQGRYVEGNQAIKRANQASLDWIMKRAAQNLKERANRREKDVRHRRLYDLVTNPAASRVTESGFTFLVDSQMAGLDARVAAYARAIESGSNYWVRRTNSRGLRLAFVGAPSYPTRGLAPVQAGYAPGHWGPVRITRPVPAYHWVRDAVDDFKKAGMYTRYANRELRAARLPVPTRARASGMRR